MGKKVLGFILTVCLILTMIPMTVSAAPEADTSWYDNYDSMDEFHIKTAAQLYALTISGQVGEEHKSFEGKTIYLDNDIDMSEFGKWPATYTGAKDTGNNDISSFMGTFDGQLNSITGFSGAPLFTSIRCGTIKNLHIDGNMDRAPFAAALAGNTAKTIPAYMINCIATGTVVCTGTGSFDNPGGLVGSTNLGAIIMDSYALNTVKSATVSAGGIVGTCSSANDIIQNCYALNESVTATKNGYKSIGRIYGGPNSQPQIIDCFGYVDMSHVGQEFRPSPANRNGEDISVEEINQLSFVREWNFRLPDYLYIEQPEPDPVNTLTVKVGESTDRLGAANFLFDASLPANNVNLVEAVFSFDAESFSVENVSLLSNLTVNIINTYYNDNKIVVLLGVANENTIAYEEITSLVRFTLVAKDDLKPETATVTLESAALYSMGELVSHEIIDASATADLNYRLPMDVNGDDVVDAADLSLMLYFFGAQEGDDEWDAACFADLNQDGVVDMSDIQTLVWVIYGF